MSYVRIISVENLDKFTEEVENFYGNFGRISNTNLKKAMN